MRESSDSIQSNERSEGVFRAGTTHQEIGSRIVALAVALNLTAAAFGAEDAAVARVSDITVVQDCYANSLFSLNFPSTLTSSRETTCIKGPLTLEATGVQSRSWAGMRSCNCSLSLTETPSTEAEQAQTAQETPALKWAPLRAPARTPLLARFGVLAPEFSAEDETAVKSQPVQEQQVNPGKAAVNRLQTSLESPVAGVPAPLRFIGNGGRGVKTWLSENYVFEINPRWLDFSMFDSMDLCMTEKPLGPGEYAPQLWRNTFTVGVGADWQLARTLGLHAGYRFYNNPVPDEVSAGAFPNASQHVLAMAMSFRQGPHTIALTYGVDFFVAATDSGISSARQGDNIDPLAHLVSLAYNYSF